MSSWHLRGRRCDCREKHVGSRLWPHPVLPAGPRHVCTSRGSVSRMVTSTSKEYAEDLARGSVWRSQVVLGVCGCFSPQLPQVLSSPSASAVSLLISARLFEASSIPSEGHVLSARVAFSSRGNDGQAFHVPASTSGASRLPYPLFEFWAHGLVETG